MAEDQLRSIVEEIRARLQAELDRQLRAAAVSHEHALAELRRTAEADAERRWAAKLETARAEWNARLQSEVAAARSEVERTMDEIARLKAETDEMRQRAERELTHTRAAFDAERASTTDALAEARKASAASAASGNDSAEILNAIREIDNSTSLSTALAAVTRAAASQAPRAAMFVVHGSELREWPVTGVAGVDAGPIRADGREAGFLSDALRTGESQTIGENGAAGVCPAGSGTLGRRGAVYARRATGRGSVRGRGQQRPAVRPVARHGPDSRAACVGVSRVHDSDQNGAGDASARRRTAGRRDR